MVLAWWVVVLAWWVVALAWWVVVLVWWVVGVWAVVRCARCTRSAVGRQWVNAGWGFGVVEYFDSL